MTREEYIRCRNANVLTETIIYNYYVSRCKELGLDILNPEVFFHFYTMYPYQQEAMNSIVQYYDIKFEVVVLTQGGKFIKAY